MFANSRHVQISGNPRFIYNDNQSSLGLESLDEGIRLLVSRVVKGAMHNSGERFDAPTCHVETRTAIQEDILGWADEPTNGLNDLVTWLHGPAGAGKSAIAQTIAQKLYARGQLTASFFFSRASGSVGRGAETDLIATLAHQLSQSVPATKPHIAAAVRQNPLVFDLALQDQVDALIVIPLMAVSRPLSEQSRPRIIVVDGLDECRKENDAQRRVVDALISALRQIPHHSHKLFITSRPEHKIVTIFNKYAERLLRRMELDNEWDPDHDIRTFLDASFADVRRSHFYFRSRPMDQTWPEPEDLDTLVRRSSGQFIYASVVLKYIKSEENYSPVTRLQTILSLTNNDDRPYAELDALYEYIFSQIRVVDRLRVLTILSLHQNFHSLPIDSRPKPPLSSFLSEFIGMDLDEIKFCLVPLVSLLVWKEEEYEEEEIGGEKYKRKKKYEGIHYMHASLLDFLLDQSRSDVFCIGSLPVATEIVRRAVELLVDGTALKRPIHMPTLIAIPQRYATMLPSDQKFHIHLLASNFNVVETVLSKMHPEIIQSGQLLFALNSYLSWVLEESKGKNASYCLSNSADQIRTWLTNQFEQLRFNNLDNTEEIDLRPFFARDDLTDWLKISTKRLSEDLSSALEIYESSPKYHQTQRRSTLSLSHDTEVLCYLMSDSICLSGSDSWFFRPDLFGRYALTTEHYEVALRCVAYYLLQLPQHTLLEVLDGSNSEKDSLASGTPIMCLIREVLSRLLYLSPLTTDLYFLVVLTYPVMRSIVGHYDLSDYLSKAFDEFPFLTERDSSSFILAKASLIETCGNLTSKTSLHELAAMGKLKMDYGFDEWQKVEYEELLAAFAITDERIPESG